VIKVLIILFSILFFNLSAQAESKSLYKLKERSLPKDVASGAKWSVSLGVGMRPHQIQLVNSDDGHPVRSGNQSIRFEIREGDCGYDVGSWNDCENDRHRSELYQYQKNNRGFKHKFFAWSIYLPEDFVSVDPVELVMCSIHQSFKGKRISKAPSVMFQFNNGGYWINRLVDGFWQEKDSYSGYFKKNAHLIDAKDMIGKWTDVVLEFKSTKKKNGIIKVWINGELKYDYKGRTSDGGRNYYKFGLYQTWVSRINYTPPKPWIDGTEKKKSDPYPTQIVYYDDVRIGKSYDDVTESFNKSN
jgi:hypothetical protein